MGIFTKILKFKNSKEFEEPEKKLDPKPLSQPTEPDTLISGFNSAFSSLSQYSSIHSSIKDLINTYREMTTNFEIEEALKEIVNEAIVFEENENVTLNLDNTELSDNIKEKIIEKFKKILNLLDWNNKSHEIFLDWFVDARLYYQESYLSGNNGLGKLTPLDPLRLKRIKDEDQNRIYYEYEHNENETYQIDSNIITFVPSGLLSKDKKYYISELNRSIRPLNNLRLIEDSALIYYITRAPQKRVFKIDASGIPKKKVDQYVNQMIEKFRSRISYDPTTGKISNRNKNIPVNEDFYLPHRNGEKGMDIDTLPGDTNLLDSEILSYYKKKLYKSLSVPYSRIDEDSMSTIDFGNRNTELSRQEMKMFKQTQERRMRFSVLFKTLLKKELIISKILTISEWHTIKNQLFFEWKNDAYYTMIKKQSILQSKIEILDSIDPYIGRYFSNNYIRKEVLGHTDDKIENIDQEIVKEKDIEQYKKDETGF